MKRRFSDITYMLFVFLLLKSNVLAQKLEPYGLQGKAVTALAYYGGALYAGTDDEGVFVRQTTDSVWQDFGLKGVHILSIYPHDIGPIGWGITIGAEPNYSGGDSVLTYCWSIYEPTWVPSDSGLDQDGVSRIIALDGFPDPRICGETFAGGSSGVYRRKLASNSWEQVLDIESGTAWDVTIDQSNQLVWACGISDSVKPWIARSKDKGDSWETRFLELDKKDSVCYQISIHPNNPDIIYLAISESVIKSIDGGKTWHYTGLRCRMARFYSLAIDPFNPDHLWAAGEPNENYLALWMTSFILYESFDAGATWRFVPSILPKTPEQIITAIVADPNQQNVLYVATTKDGVWRYESKALSLATYVPLQVGNWWTFSKLMTETIIDTIRISDSLYFKFDQYRHFPKVLLWMKSDNKLLLRDNTTEQIWLDFSANIGDNWKVTAPDGTSEWTVHLQSKSDTVIVPAGTFTNCYRFWFQFNGADNDWMEWYAPGVGPVKRILHGFAVIEYPLTAAYINGFYLPTEVEPPFENRLPNRCYLYPNYPNPFNAITVIPFDLPNPASITLEIYNVIGKKVRTIMVDQKPAGHFEVQWDGTDDLGNAAASGIYFCRLHATKQSNESVIQVRKLILLR